MVGEVLWELGLVGQRAVAWGFAASQQQRLSHDWLYACRRWMAGEGLQQKKASCHRFGAHSVPVSCYRPVYKRISARACHEHMTCCCHRSSPSSKASGTVLTEIPQSVCKARRERVEAKHAKATHYAGMTERP